MFLEVVPGIRSSHGERAKIFRGATLEKWLMDDREKWNGRNERWIVMSKDSSTGSQNKWIREGWGRLSRSEQEICDGSKSRQEASVGTKERFYVSWVRRVVNDFGSKDLCCSHISSPAQPSSVIYSGGGGGRIVGWEPERQPLWTHWDRQKGRRAPLLCSKGAPTCSYCSSNIILDEKGMTLITRGKIFCKNPV